MLSKDIQIGMRVNVHTNDLKALIVGKPEYYTPRSKLVRIKYENSTRYEYMITNQLSPLPKVEQYPALGGEFIKPESYF